MTFRHARHTNDLDKIEAFYTEVVGLEKLGDFKNHDNYNGLFLGYKNLDWHLEFTSSNEQPNSKFGDDDILVFYVNAEIELSKLKELLKQRKIQVEKPKNPYWAKNGVMVSDPDNHKVVFSIKHQSFTANDKLTKLVLSRAIKNWNELIELTKQLPYGRNANRSDFSLVLKENKGTCSSKHSFLKKVADLNNFNNVKLILGIYKMNHINTPGIGNIIVNNNLKYIPEAHCYLKLNNKRIDITHTNSNIDSLAADIIEEIEIEPEQVSTFKVDYHKNYLQKWIKQEGVKIKFDEIWAIREACIKKLEEKH